MDVDVKWSPGRTYDRINTLVAVGQWVARELQRGARTIGLFSHDPEIHRHVVDAIQRALSPRMDVAFGPGGFDTRNYVYESADGRHGQVLVNAPAQWPFDAMWTDAASYPSTRWQDDFHYGVTFRQARMSSLQGPSYAHWGDPPTRCTGPTLTTHADGSFSLSLRGRERGGLAVSFGGIEAAQQEVVDLLAVEQVMES